MTQWKHGLQTHLSPHGPICGPRIQASTPPLMATGASDISIGPVCGRAMGPDIPSPAQTHMTPCPRVAVCVIWVCMGPAAAWPSGTKKDSDRGSEPGHQCGLWWQHRPQTAHTEAMVGPRTQTWPLAVDWARMSS